MSGDHEKTTTLAAGFARVQQYAKTIVTGVGGLTSVGLLTNLPEPYNFWFGLGTALLTTVATYRVPNAKPAEEQTTAGYPDVLKTEPEDALG